MPRLVAILVIVAFALMAARTFTGIVYGGDSPIAYLVLKSRPDLRIERPEHDGAPVTDLTVLDHDEPGLVYEPVYAAAMRVAPFVSVAALLAAMILVRTRRRRA